MKMYVPILFLLISLTCFAVDQTFFIYKGRIFRMTNDHIDTVSKLQFNKRSSILEYAIIEGFFVIKVSDSVFKLYDLPIHKQSRLQLLKDAEAKTDEDIKQI